MAREEGGWGGQNILSRCYLQSNRSGRLRYKSKFAPHQKIGSNEWIKTKSIIEKAWTGQKSINIFFLPLGREDLTHQNTPPLGGLGGGGNIVTFFFFPFFFPSIPPFRSLRARRLGKDPNDGHTHCYVQGEPWNGMRRGKISKYYVPTDYTKKRGGQRPLLSFPQAHYFFSLSLSFSTFLPRNNPALS